MVSIIFRNKESLIKLSRCLVLCPENCKTSALVVSSRSKLQKLKLSTEESMWTSPAAALGKVSLWNWKQESFVLTFKYYVWMGENWLLGFWQSGVKIKKKMVRVWAFNCLAFHTAWLEDTVGHGASRLPVWIGWGQLESKVSLWPHLVDVREMHRWPHQVLSAGT